MQKPPSSISSASAVEEEFHAMALSSLEKFEAFTKEAQESSDLKKELEKLKLENQDLKQNLKDAKQQTELQQREIDSLRSFRFGIETLRVIRCMEKAVAIPTSNEKLHAIRDGEWKIALTPREFNRLCVALQSKGGSCSKSKKNS